MSPLTNRKTQIRTSYPLLMGAVSGEKILFEHEDTQTLTKLGLTGSQAKVYLALIKLGKANARTLWKAVKVSRQDVYRLLTELREIGLIEKILETPTEFKAVSIEDGVSILIERKTKEVFGLQKEGDSLIQKFKESNLSVTLEPDESQYILIPEGEVLALRLNKAIESTQKSIDIISSMKSFAKGLYFTVEELNKALRRGVKIRWVINKPEDPKSWSEIVQALTKNPHFKIRTIPNSPYVRFGVCDKKEVFMAFFPKRDVLESPTLWSTNISFVKMVQSFFDTIWSTAVEQT